MSYHLAALPGLLKNTSSTTTQATSTRPATTSVVTQVSSVKPYLNAPTDLVTEALGLLQQLGLLSTPTPSQAEFDQAVASFRALVNRAGGPLNAEDIRAMRALLVSFNAPPSSDVSLVQPDGGTTMMTTQAASKSGIPGWVRPVGAVALLLFLFSRKRGSK